MAVERMIFVIGMVIMAVIFGIILIMIAGKIFPKMPEIACDFLRSLLGSRISSFAGCVK